MEAKESIDISNTGMINSIAATQTLINQVQIFEVDDIASMHSRSIGSGSEARSQTSGTNLFPQRSEALENFHQHLLPVQFHQKVAVAIYS